MDGEEITFLCIILFLFGLMVGTLITGIDGNKSEIDISQETADKICLDLTQEEGVIAQDWWDFGRGKEPIEKGELYCQLPTYDSTQLIKVGN